MKKISVIVPIYNSEKYLRECIDSIINQTYKDLEILLINDGSVDKSLDIIQEFEKKDTRIVVIDKKNTGVSDTRNVGIKNASGNYISFVDSDDTVELNMYEKMINKMNDKTTIVICNANIYDINKKIKNNNFYELSNSYIENSNELIERFITHEKSIPSYTPVMLIKKESIVEFNSNLKFMEDTEFYLRLMLNNNSVYFLDEHLYNYRYNETSASKNVDKVASIIFNLLDTMLVIKDDLIKTKKLTEELNLKINTNTILILINKLKLLKNQKYSQIKKTLDLINNNKNFLRIKNNVNIKEFTMKKKLVYFLLRNNYKSILAIVLK